MGDPLSLFTRVLPINTACPTSSAYVHGDFQYFPTQYTLTTPERCAEQCVRTDACTGFETRQMGVDADSIFCQLWLRGACSGPNATGALLLGSDTVTTCVNRILTRAPYLPCSSLQPQSMPRVKAARC